MNYKLYAIADYELVEMNENLVKNMIGLVDDTIKTILSKRGL